MQHRDMEMVVIVQPDGTFACIPAWMTKETAAHFKLSEELKVSIDFLRALRTETTELLKSLQSESHLEKNDDRDATRGKHSTRSVRQRAPSRPTSKRTNGGSGNAAGNAARRDRGVLSKRGE